MLNCASGDMFIIIVGEEAGKIGICEYLAHDNEILQVASSVLGERIDRVQSSNVWKINFTRKWIMGDVVCEIPYISDEFIRPLRDTDEEDEMLRVAGKPAIVENSTVAGKPKEKENIE